MSRFIYCYAECHYAECRSAPKQLARDKRSSLLCHSISDEEEKLLEDRRLGFGLNFDDFLPEQVAEVTFFHPAVGLRCRQNRRRHRRVAQNVARATVTRRHQDDDGDRMRRLDGLTNARQNSKKKCIFCVM